MTFATGTKRALAGVALAAIAARDAMTSMNPLASATQTPTTQSPATQSPTTQAPTTQAPSTQAPTAQTATTPDPASTAEPVFRYSALDNGRFAETNATVRDARGLLLLPWWVSSRGMDMVVRRDDSIWTRCKEGESIEQPIPAYAPLVGSFVFRGTGELGSICTLRDGTGASSTATIASLPKDAAITLRLADLKGTAGEDRSAQTTVPRLMLSLSGAWSDVQVTVDLPCPSEAALRAEIVAEIDEILKQWFELGIDDVGPRKTGFLTRLFDAVTGKPLLVTRTTGFNSIYQALLDATEVEDSPAWRALLERMLGDFLELQLNPDTGLPRNWDCTADVPDDTTPIEIALPLGFLIDVADHGPVQFRERARAAAIRIGDTVLAKGLVPDGTCAASYVPRDGKPNLDVGLLRRLDVPLQLVRLARLTGDARYAKAVREPLWNLEFTNYWAGTWEAIDPGFDDDFGHYGARAARAARAMPEDTLFRRFAVEGWKHYEPIWRDALRFGGNVAADQVRCWKIGVDLAHVDPSMRASMGPLLRTAARSHFKGEQYGNGAWGDVTIFRFSPRVSGMEVGDLTGSPQNLLSGLASIYVDELGLRTDEIRAMYTTVLRSSITAYKKEYGFITDRTARQGPNPATGSLRMLTGLVEMLRALSAPK